MNQNANVVPPCSQIGVPTVPLARCQMTRRTSLKITLKNQVSARSLDLPSASSIDPLALRMIESQETAKERLRKSTISAPIRLTNAAWRLSHTSPPSALVVRQISFRGIPGWCMVWQKRIMSQCATIICVAQILLDSCSDPSGN